jgi:hypothetical protein
MINVMHLRKIIMEKCSVAKQLVDQSGVKIFELFI